MASIQFHLDSAAVQPVQLQNRCSLRNDVLVLFIHIVLYFVVLCSRFQNRLRKKKIWFDTVMLNTLTGNNNAFCRIT